MNSGLDQQSSDHSSAGQGCANDAAGAPRRVAFELFPGLTVRPVQRAGQGASGFRYEVDLSWQMAERVALLLAPFLPMAEAVTARVEAAEHAAAQREARDRITDRKRLVSTAGRLANRAMRRVHHEGLDGALSAIGHRYDLDASTLKMAAGLFRRRLRTRSMRLRDSIILSMCRRGATNAEIAARFHLHPNTAGRLVREIKRKLTAKKGPAA